MRLHVQLKRPFFLLQIIQNTKVITEFRENNRQVILNENSEHFDVVAELVTDSASLSNEVDQVNTYCI